MCVACGRKYRSVQAKVQQLQQAPRVTTSGANAIPTPKPRPMMKYPKWSGAQRPTVLKRKRGG